MVKAFKERSPITVGIAEKDVAPFVAACRHVTWRSGKPPTADDSRQH
jgi:hypothetical protein